MTAILVAVSAVTLAVSPVERVVSVVPAATETLFALGAGDLVVGVGSYDTWPPEALELPQVGAYLDPNFEGIVSLRPDLVVLDAGQDAMARRLRNAGIATFAFRHGDLEVTFGMMEALGEAVGRPDAGRRLADRVRRRLDELAARYGEGPRLRVLLVFGRGGGGFRNLWVVGGSGFLHQLLEIAGGDNVFSDVGHDSFKAGLEAVLARRPDVVLEIAPFGEQKAADLEADLGRVADEWRTLPGFGQVRVGVLAADHVGRPGPRMPETVRLMAEALHGGRGVGERRGGDHPGPAAGLRARPKATATSVAPGTETPW